jgi:N-acetylglucosamine-6-phosphate deacetylase
MRLAIDAGVRHLTHAFNAMPGIHHRKPGLLTAALLDPRVGIELIADGVHIHPAVLELALRLKGLEQVVLVSDGTRAVGMPDGDYDLGGQQVRLSQGKLTLPDGTIAGSAAPLLAGTRFMVRTVGRTLSEAVRMASLNPARVLGVESDHGSLRTGVLANFLRLSPELELKEVWVRGRRVIDAAPAARERNE